MAKSRHRSRANGKTGVLKDGDNGQKRFPAAETFPGTGERTAMLFPPCTPLVVAVMTLAVRVYYVMEPNSWWMIHPDEVYQSLEVAHIETYGYGFRTYEFSGPESSASVNEYQNMMQKVNMYALRSPLFPYFYVLLAWLASFLHWNPNPYMMWRLAHVVVTSALPLSVYRYGTRLTKSPDKGCLAAILVALSVHLNVLGTHCLLHSFLAPFTFIALSFLLDDRPFKNNGTTSVRCQATTVKEMSDSAESSIPNNNYNNGSDKNNNHHITHSGGVNGASPHTREKPSALPHNFSASTNLPESATQSYLAKEVTPLPRKPLEYGSADHHAVEGHIKTFPSMRFRVVQILVAGFLMTLTTYIRPDVSLIYVSHIVFFTQLRQQHLKAHFVPLTVGALGGAFIGILTDAIFYGWGVISPFNWIKFNVFSGLSSVIFGRIGALFYFEQIFIHDLGTPSLTGLALFVLIRKYVKYSIFSNKNILSTNEHMDKSSDLSLKLFLLSAVLLVIYSLNGHKETRFLHDIVVLIFMFIADALSDIQSLFNSKSFSTKLTRLLLVLFGLVQWQAMPDQSTNQAWVYQKSQHVQEVNTCINFLSAQDDVTGVFYDNNLYMSAGMTLLHHDVTVMTLVTGDRTGGFYEFAPQSRRNYTKRAAAWPWDTSFAQPESVVKSINDFINSYNYVSMFNAPAVTRLIILNPNYNYLVLRRNRRFFNFGFREVFGTEKIRVMKRSLDRESEYRLQGLLDRITMGTNATVLVHEGDVLFHMGQYQQAADRFSHAIHVDETMLDAYKPLEICFYKLGNLQASQAVKGKCEALFGEKSCSSLRKMTRM